MVVRNRKPPWTELPQELLSAIGNSLTNPLDILSFRSVCKSWRSSFPRLTHPSIYSPTFPLSVPRSPFPFRLPFSSRPVCNSLISVTVIYALRRPLDLSSWFLFLDEYTPGKVTLRKPFSVGPYNLPINFPKTINLIDDFNALELGRFYNLSYLNDYSDGWYPSKLNRPPRFCAENFNKLVFLPNGLAAFALFDEGKLGMISLDGGISEWEIIHDGKGLRFDDIVEFKGRVLGIDRRGRVYEIGCHSFEKNHVVPPITGGGGRRKRLVESLGLLYLVVRCNDNPCRTNRRNKGLNEDRLSKFKVYKLDEEKKRWVEITSLDDRSFFFGHHFSFSASAEELGTCGKNCILFKNRSFQYYSGEYGDTAMFHKSKNTGLEIGVSHLDDVDQFGVIESFPGYSDILWPPPRCIWPIARSERLEKAETAIDDILERITNRKAYIPEEIKREALKLKEIVIRLRKGEDGVMFMDKISQTFGSMDGSREPMDMLNRLENRLQQARTSSSEEFQTYLKQLRVLLRKHDDVLFEFEEQVTAVGEFC